MLLRACKAAVSTHSSARFYDIPVRGKLHSRRELPPVTEVCRTRQRKETEPEVRAPPNAPTMDGDDTEKLSLNKNPSAPTASLLFPSFPYEEVRQSIRKEHVRGQELALQLLGLASLKNALANNTAAFSRSRLNGSVFEAPWQSGAFPPPVPNQSGGGGGPSMLQHQATGCPFRRALTEARVSSENERHRYTPRTTKWALPTLENAVGRNSDDSPLLPHAACACRSPWKCRTVAMPSLAATRTPLAGRV